MFLMEALLYFCALTHSEDKVKPSKIAPSGEESFKGIVESGSGSSLRRTDRRDCNTLINKNEPKPKAQCASFIEQKQKYGVFLVREALPLFPHFMLP